MSATGYLENTLTKHMVFLQRYAAGLNNTQEERFKDLARDVSMLINNDLTSFGARRLNVIVNQLNTMVGVAMSGYVEEMTAAFEEYIPTEVEFQTKAHQAVLIPTLAQVSVDRVEALFTEKKMSLVSGKAVRSQTIEEMLETFVEAIGDSSASTIRQMINVGVAAGDNADKITRRIAKKLEGDIGSPNGKIRTWSKTNLLTAVNHVSQQARNEVVAANSDYFDEEKWSSVLDGHTSLVCAGRDSTIYKIGEGPYPPAHMRCRSLRLVYIKPEYAIIKKSERASVQGPVDSRTTYNSWLKRQNNAFQDEALLSKTRGDLFRSGKVSVKDFTDDAGRTLTLDELVSKEGITLN